MARRYPLPAPSPGRSSSLALLGLLAACQSGPTLPRGFAALLAEAPNDQLVRLQCDGDRLVGVCVPIAGAALPPAVRQTLDAVAPRGELRFCGREWGLGGDGFRIEKVYRLDRGDQVRSAWIAADGTVLERSHSVPVLEAPQPVLAALTEFGTGLDELHVVSGPWSGEVWRATIGDRLGRTFVVEVSPTGQRLRAVRRQQARVEG